MDLARVSFALKVVQFLDRQTAEKLDPPLDLEGGLQKMLVFFFLRTLERRGIFNAPMGGHWHSGKNRASFTGIVRECDDKVKVAIGKLVPRIPDGTGRVDFEVFAQNFQNDRVDFPFRSFTGARDLKAVSPQGTKEIFGENAPLRVTSAEEQNTEGWAHNGKLFTDKRRRTASLFQSCDKIVTILPLAFAELIG